MAAIVAGMLDTFAHTSPEPATTAPHRTSDRQRDAPIGWAVAALRWSPKPSAAALVGIDVAGRVMVSRWQLLHRGATPDVIADRVS